MAGPNQTSFGYGESHGHPGVEKYRPADMIAAIHYAKGLITYAAQRLGCSPGLVTRYAQRYPDVQEALDEERHALVDLAELRLHKAVTDGEPWAIQMVLRTLGRRRGWAEKDAEQLRDGRAPAITEIEITLPRLPEPAQEVEPSPVTEAVVFEGRAVVGEAR